MPRGTTALSALLAATVLLAGCGTPTIVGPVATASFAQAPASQAPASPSPSLLATPAQLPAALWYAWVGETRTIPGLMPPAVESFMKLDGQQMWYQSSEDWTSPILTSAASAMGRNGVRLRLAADSVGCQAGEEGAYTFSLSPSGRALAVSVVFCAVAFAFAARSANRSLA